MTAHHRGLHEVRSSATDGVEKNRDRLYRQPPPSPAPRCATSFPFSAICLGEKVCLRGCGLFKGGCRPGVRVFAVAPLLLLRPSCITQLRDAFYFFFACSPLFGFYYHHLITFTFRLYVSHSLSTLWLESAGVVCVCVWLCGFVCLCACACPVFYYKRKKEGLCRLLKIISEGLWGIERVDTQCQGVRGCYTMVFLALALAVSCSL